MYQEYQQYGFTRSALGIAGGDVVSITPERGKIAIKKAGVPDDSAIQEVSKERIKWVPYTLTYLGTPISQLEPTPIP